MKTIITALLLSLSAIASAQTPFPNGDFESWYTSSTGHELPSDALWYNVDSVLLSSGYLYPTIFRSNDAYSGSNAVKIQSFDSGWARYYGDLHTGACCDSFGQIYGVQPYHDRPDSFGFYYKYSTETADTGLMIFRFTDAINGNSIGTAFTQLLPTATYTRISVPIYYFTPDTPSYLMLRITSTKTSNREDSLGTSTLLVDSIFFANNTDSVTAINELATNTRLQLYPNPAGDYIRLPQALLDADISAASIVNTAGQKFIAEIDKGSIPITHLPMGFYILSITDKNGMRHCGKFLKK